MTILLAIILLFCVAGVLHTYLVYPWWVLRKDVLAARTQVKSEGVKGQIGDKPWPPVHVLMAAHNEALVLPDKLETLRQQNYPGEIQFHIGSDNSSDATNGILRSFAAREPRLHPTLFEVRQGKPAIINQLAERAGGEGIFVLTDASVMLRPDTITELVRPMMEDKQVGVVDSTMVQTGGSSEGVGDTEAFYISREVALKRAEGRLWGAMIGPFGGCFALRARCFRPVPGTFLVDDFYLCMSAYEQGYRGLSSRTAVVEESVGQHLRDEFRRKVRISAGNWQNLVRFRGLWWPPGRDDLSFALFSHKILRWWTPFLLLVGALAWWGLAWRTGNHWVGSSLALVSGFIAAAVVADVVLAALNVHLRPLRALRYFLAMNAALLVGFGRYLTGIQSNVWTPSNRN